MFKVSVPTWNLPVKALFFLLVMTQTSHAQLLQPVSGRPLSESDILPADVFSRVTLVRKELELIRTELGRVSFPVSNIQVVDTAPREVYFMASALYDKADRLAFEYVKTSEQYIKTVDAASIKPYHVWLMANRTFRRLQSVKEILLIPEKSVELISPSSTTPSDVIGLMIKANQELDILLSQKSSPADVFQQVTLAINLNAQLLATVEDSKRIPDQPEMIRRKTPEDVYRRLALCLELLRNISHSSNLSVMDFDIDSLYTGRVKPGDVYALATLLVADVSYFHALREQTKDAAGAFYPGNKTPSHVFQRVGILEAQLKQLLEFARENPQWLTAK